jgi:hypothetical protein
MKTDVIRNAGNTDQELEQTAKSTIRLGAIILLVGAGVMALIALATTGESRARDIGSSVSLAAIALGALRILRGYRQYQQGRRLTSRRKPSG